MSAHDFSPRPERDTDIAIIGMAARFPGSRTLEEFWENLKAGRECITSATDSELRRAGVPQQQFADPRYVRARSRLDGVELFDAGLFGLSAREAEITDPQHRVFLELAWEALEHAGYGAHPLRLRVGVYGGAALSTYLLFHLLPNPAVLASVGELEVLTANDKDFLATRVSYKLNLRGPSITVQSACSTSVVAAHLACQSLICGECDLALAGGVSIVVPQERGYLHRPGGILSPDGHCRAFDASAAGTVFGNGAGIVVLRRLEDALAERDSILAIIRGSAVNNDGSGKIGYTAPSADGQAAVISEAIGVAGVDPATIQYIEAHGTGTALGDPIEVAALRKVFGASRDGAGSCALGSVKTNIGHLDAAAGIAGLIKVVLALRNRAIPPTLHFNKPNPEIEFSGGPFFVNTALRPWSANGEPRRAGVSSFGIGGTNAHVVVEEAPARPAAAPSRGWQILPISARSPAALRAASCNLKRALEDLRDDSLPDAAYTLQTGRRRFACRRALLVRDRGDAISQLSREAKPFMEQREDRPVVFLFPGQGSHEPGMARGLYRDEPVFREHVDRCAGLLTDVLQTDVRDVMFDSGASERLQRTEFAQPALFVLEHALAQLWMEWGVRPHAMIGHSLGEYTAACLAGVFPLEEALRIVAHRARLMQAMAPGAMLAVFRPEGKVLSMLGPPLAMAAVNGPDLCVISGPPETVAALERDLAARGIGTRRLRTSHAFHSPSMDEVIEPLTNFIDPAILRRPAVPVLSNVTGDWMGDRDALDPDYWGRHLRRTVRFGDGLSRVLHIPDVLLLEIGPGRTLAGIAHERAGRSKTLVFSSLVADPGTDADQKAMLSTAAGLWLAGATLDWERFSAREERRRVHLPTYPFERQRYWIDPPAVRAEPRAAATASPEHGEPPAPEPFTPTHARPWLSTFYVAPKSDLEKEIARIWEDLLGSAPVGADDSFFELGGDSLIATRLASRIQARFPVEIPLRTVFEASTVGELAAALASLLSSARFRAEPAGAEARIPRRDPGLPIPLSFQQQRLWFLDRLDSGRTAYNIAGRFRLTGALDIPSLHRALNAIVRRHGTLRTRFEEKGGVPVQVVAPEEALPLPVIDLRNLEAEEKERRLRDLTAAEVTRPLDLAAGPLFRVVLVHCSAQEHVLLLVRHHIVADDWSLAIFIDELLLHYCLPEAQPVALPIEYADFAAWQRKHAGGELTSQIAYWKQQLAGPLPVLRLPLDHPRGKQQTFAGAVFRFEVPESFTGDVARLGRCTGATPFMVLLTCFHALLARYSGMDEVLVGSPIANRKRIELEPLIGLFANTLVLRADLSGDPTFRSLLDQVRETCLAAYENQDLPFEQLVELLQPPRDMGRSPIFDAMFVLQNAPAPKRSLPGLSIDAVEVETATSLFDLTLALTESGGILRGGIEYNTGLFEPATIARLARHYCRLLEAAVAAPDEPVSRLSFLDVEEREQVLALGQGPPVAGASGKCLHDLFEEQVRRSPGATAVCDGRSELSYRALNDAADSLARELQARGVEPEQPVAICLERSVEQVVAILAVLKAGGAYLPIDPAAPRERIASLLADAGARLAVTRQELRSLVEVSGVEVLDIGTSAESAFHPSSLPRVRPDNLAYIIYTSGSTGTPKGVLVTHHNVVRSTLARLQFYEKPVESFLLLSSYTFDSSVAGLFWTLGSGGRLVIPPEGIAADARALAKLLPQYSITHLLAIPALYRQLLDEASAPSLASLRTAIVAGEACPVELVQRHFRTVHDAGLVNEYGPTEATVWSTAARCAAADVANVPIGHAIPGTLVYIADRHLNLLPAGMIGELYLGGPSIARGYMGRSDLTAERFLPDPFGNQPGARLYRSGDLVRYRADGQLEFVGRTDRQLKIRGMRIEPAEIENALAAHPDVKDVAVVAGPDRIDAYVVPSSQPGPDASELSSYLWRRFPPSLIPRAITLLRTLPRTRNGKLNYSALASFRKEPDTAGRSERPPTAGEALLAQIWSELLGLESVDIHASFFELGGHSLLAARALAQAGDAFGVDLPLRALFECPTIEALAQRLETARKPEAGKTAVPFRTMPRLLSAARKEPRWSPLSFAQERLWFLDRLNPGSGTYNMPIAARLSGRLDVAALTGGIAEIVRRHETLRTSFGIHDGQPAQCIWLTADVPLRLVDLRGLAPHTRQERLSQETADEARRPFDLTRAPLLRTTLIKVEDEDHLLLVSTHHIVSDAWSLNVLIRELAAAYTAIAAGGQLLLAPLSVQYTDYVAWQREWLTPEVIESHVAYWRMQLAGAVPAELFPDRPRPAVSRMKGALHEFTISTGLSQELACMARREHATPFMVLFAAFGALLRRMSGQDDIVVGTPIASRRQREVESLIGLFVNLVVLRLDCSCRPHFSDLVRRAKRVMLDADAHGGLPYEKLVNALNPVRDLSRQALFQIAFAVQNAPDDAIFVPGLTITHAAVHSGTAKFDITMALTEHEESWHGSIEYNSDLFDAATISRLAQRYTRLLEVVASDAETPVDEVLFYDADECRAKSLPEVEADREPARCLHELFEQQVRRSPDGVAVCDGIRTLTYSDLNDAAARLAHWLRAHGVTPEQPVAICMERSVDLPVVILATLKAGGAYLPLDPALPRDRLVWMLADAGARVVLTQPELRGLIATPGVRIIDVTSAADDVPVPPAPGVHPDNVAYIIYTSGSTGTPKGVLVTHANVVRLFAVTNSRLRFSSSDVWTLFHSASFDFSVWEIWGALLYGGRVVVVPRDVQRSPQAFHQLLSKERVTVLNQTPSAFRHLARAVLSAPAPLALTLRLVIFGGEALELPQLRDWFERFGGDRPRLVNMYGITETTVHVTYREIGLADLDTSWASPIGLPLADLRAFILDRDLRPMPAGVPGELYVGGAGVARGYLGHPELTAERFLPDPISGIAGARLYKTGDRVRLRLSGELEYLGRVDHQVKIRGFRVETGEIEAVLRVHPGVRDAAVVGRRDGDGETRLLAYIVCTSGWNVRVDPLRAWLAERLPEYMLPAAFVFLDAFPRTSGGKIDRLALPAPGTGRPDLENEYVAPRGKLERKLAAAWADVLKVKQVGVHDNFFSLGGNSLLLAQVHATLQDGIAPGIPLVALFQHPTVRALAEHLQSANGVPTAAERGLARAAARRSSHRSAASGRAGASESTEP
jgi:amino acid adenylation domain-containing protein